MNQRQVLIASPNEVFFKEVQTLLTGFYPYHLIPLQKIDDITEKYLDIKPVLLIVDAQNSSAVCAEWVQGLKTVHQSPLLVLHTTEDLLDYEHLRKNGADEIMHLYFDREFISDIVLNLAPIEFENTRVPLPALQSISMDDLEPDSQLNFDMLIHLPGNQKTLVFRRKDSQFQKTDIDKILNSKQRVYFKKTEAKLFYDYARNLRSIKSALNPSAMTEQLIRAKRSMYEMMSHFFSAEKGTFKSGQEIYNNCLKIINEFQILQNNEQPLKQISKFTGQFRTYYHEAINVSAFAAVFARAIGLNEKQVESLAYAGLLHNIGLSKLHCLIYEVDFLSLKTETKDLYYRYPANSVYLVRNKKVPLPQEVSKIIEDHQERIDGSGFPRKITGDDIDPLAKVLQIAIYFQELTALVANEPRFTPQAALEHMKSQTLEGQIKFDPKILLEICRKLT